MENVESRFSQPPFFAVNDQQSWKSRLAVMRPSVPVPQVAVALAEVPKAEEDPEVATCSSD